MTKFSAGNWNAICDRCGFKFKSNELRKDWQGLMVCDKDFELRNQQDFIRVKPERAIPTWTRPEPAEAFLLYELLADSFRATSGEGEDVNTQTYVDETYFAQDYIEPLFSLTVTFNRIYADIVSGTDALAITTTKPVSDTVTTSELFSTSFVSLVNVNDPVTVSDGGFTSIPNYVDSSYFSGDYVYDIVSF